MPQKQKETLSREAERHGPWLELAVLLAVVFVVSYTLDLISNSLNFVLYIPLVWGEVTLQNFILYSAVFFVAIYVGYLGIKELLFEKRFSIEFLMSVAALGALYLGFLFEGFTVLLLYSLAEFFEGYIEDRARKTVEKISSYLPSSATVIRDNIENIINIEDVKIGDVLLVRAGERIPLDSIIIDGQTYIDQSVVTGESEPVFKKKDDYVYAGTLNLNGVIKIRVTKKSDETLVSKIVDLVLEARERKASIENLVDRFAKIYVPIVLLVALLTVSVVPLLFGSFEIWLYRSLILIVIACPSAFVVSVPATMFTAVTVAAQKGIIIKGGLYIEKLARVKVVVFDKTGTLTLGKPKLKEIHLLDNLDEKTAILYAAALERYSKHPLAEAIVARANELKINLYDFQVENVSEFAGKGIRGKIGEHDVVIGNKELIQEYVHDVSKLNAIPDGHTRIILAVDGSIVATFCVRDEIRDDAKESIKVLKRLGIKTIMLTGDKREKAEEVAEILEIDEVYSELLPDDKLRIIENLRHGKNLVAMIGDGINDAPALAAADVGIAMGSTGIDVSLETADIVLVKDELIKVPFLIEMSRRAVKIAKQNIAGSLGIKMLLGVLGFIGITTLWFTVAVGDDGLTFLLLLNTARLIRNRF
ncbi:MAG: heavy metal translocating P-type ATPase [Candidatus Asgardarchaeia archaeon]